MGFLPTYLIEDRGIGAGTAALVTALAVSVNAIGNVVAGWLLHRGAQRWMLIVTASAVMAVSAVGIYSGLTDDSVKFTLCFVFSVVGGLLPASILGATADFTPRRDLIGTTNGLVMQGSNIGQMIGPPAVAAIVAASGTWSAGPVYVVAAAGIGIVLAIRIGRFERSRA